MTRRALCDILSYINLHTYIDRGALSQKYPEKMSPGHGEKGRVPKYASLAGRTLAKTDKICFAVAQGAEGYREKVGILMF